MELLITRAELMVEVVNKSQQVRTAGLSPKSAYSRVVAVNADVADGAGNQTYQYSQSFGQRLWLLRVDVWLFTENMTNIIDGMFSIMTGQEPPDRPQSMLDQWTTIIPKHRGDINMFRWTGNREHFGWDMSRLYTATPRMFGIVLVNFSATVAFSVIATFTISEG